MAGTPCFIGHEGQEALYLDRCPFCDADSDDTRRFEQEDGRMGGLLHCACCRLRISWIDAPFEYEVQEDQDHRPSAITPPA